MSTLFLGFLYPRQGAGSGLPRGLRQVPVVSERVRAGTLSPCPLQDAGLRRQRGLSRQRKPHWRGHRHERGQHSQLRGGHPYRRARNRGTGDEPVRRRVDRQTLQVLQTAEVLCGSDSVICHRRCAMFLHITFYVGCSISKIPHVEPVSTRKKCVLMKSGIC